MDVTTWLAICGTIMGAVALGWNISRDLRDRAKLVVDAFIGKRVPMGESSRVDALHDEFIMTVTNVGRRSIWVTGWGAVRRKGTEGPPGRYVVPGALPRVLGEGEYVMEHTTDLSILSPEIARVFAWDSIGRKWNLPRRQLRKLQAQAKELALSPASRQARRSQGELDHD